MSDERIQPWRARPPVGKLSDRELGEIRELLALVASGQVPDDVHRLDAWNYVKLIDQLLKED